MSCSLPTCVEPFIEGNPPEQRPSRFLLIVSYFALLPLADVLNGASVYYFGNSFSIAIASKSILFAFVAGQLLARARLSLGDILFFLCPIFVLLWLAALNGQRGGGMTKELFAILRGPALLVVTYLALRLQRPEHAAACVSAYVRSFWYIAAVTIIATKFLHIGFATYHGLGGKGFYIAGNEITMAFAAVAGYWILVIPRSVYGQMAYGLVSCCVLFILGTKAGWLIFAIIFGWEVSKRIFRDKAVTALVCLGMVIAGGFFLQEIIFLLGPHMLSWSIVQRSIERVGLWEGLTSGRWNTMMVAVDVLRSFSPVDWAIGVGRDFFAYLLAGSIGEGGRRSPEEDILDLLGSCGLLGVLWYYSLTIFGIVRGFLQRGAGRDRPMIILFALMVCSVVCGHVAFAATLSIVVGILLWTLICRQGGQENRPAVCAAESPGAS